MNEPFTTWSGTTVPLIEDDVNTDQIAPATAGPKLGADYANILFQNRMLRPDGLRGETFVLNRPEFAQPAILVSGHNFGCGSSRESAVWALKGVGIRCVVARSFADFFRENCLQNGILPIALASADADAFEKLVIVVNGALPFTADLTRNTISAASGEVFTFTLPAADRMRLLEGLDDIGLTMKHETDIASWEKRTAAARPWQQTIPNLYRQR